jgi:uncharacterized protein YhaN
MRILGWSIDDFGPFSDFNVQDLPPGLTVFHGPNESGKSTLIAFVAGVLFGFHRSWRDGPSAGGRSGGRLLVAGRDGEYTIERRAEDDGRVRLVRPDGGEGGPEDLQRLLGGVHAELFRAVFAFGQRELMSFSALDREELRERLFSAPVAGAGRCARAVLADLESRSATLLAERGDARVNALVAALNDLRPRLDAARRAAAGYAELRDEADWWCGEVERLRGDLEEDGARRRRLEMLLDLWPAWRALGAARRELAALEPIDEFPGEAPARLAAAAARRDQARRALRGLREEQRRARDARDALGSVGSPCPGEALESVRDRLPAHRDNAALASRLRSRRAEVERAEADRLGLAGAGWSEERLAAFDAAGAARDGRLRGEALRAARAEQERARHALAIASDSWKAAERERFGASARLPATPPAEPDALARRRQALSRLRANLAAVQLDQMQAEARDRAVHERERGIRVLKGESVRRPSAWPVAAAGAALVAAAAAVTGRALGGDPFAFGMLAMVVLLAATGGYDVARRQRRASERERARQASLRALRSELQGLRRSRDAHWQSAASLRDSVSSDAAELSLPRFPTAQAIEERALELGEQEVARARWEVQRARLDELNERVRGAWDALQARQAELAAAEEAVRRAAAAWQGWKSAAGLAGDLAPERLADRLIEIDRARAGAADLDAARRACEVAERSVAQWEAQARSALRRAGAPAGEDLCGEALIAQVEAAASRPRAAHAGRWEAAALEGELRSLGRRIATLEEDLRACEAEHDRILSEAGAADEIELRRRREIHARRRQMRLAIEEREADLAARLAQGEREEVLAALADGTPEGWRGEIEAIDARVEEDERLLAQAAANLRETRQGCRALEESAQVAALENEWSGLLAELDTAVAQWRVFAIARGLVEESLHEYRRTRQPEVLIDASKIFAAATGGRYARIVQDESGGALTVVQRDGRRKRLDDELSCATAEQLYVSLRLGLVADFARRDAALPVLMDDVLANADPARARAMADALARFARGGQVLYFTSHPETRDLLRSVGGAARVVEISTRPA